MQIYSYFFPTFNTMLTFELYFWTEHCAQFTCTEVRMLTNGNEVLGFIEYVLVSLSESRDSPRVDQRVISAVHVAKTVRLVMENAYLID